MNLDTAVRYEIIKEILAIRQIYKNNKTFLMTAMLAEAAEIASENGLDKESFTNAAKTAMEGWENERP